MILFLTVIVSNAVNYTSAKTGVWNDPTTWSPNGIPGSADNVTIVWSHQITFPGSSSNVEINNLNFSSSLNIGGNLTINGTFSYADGSNLTVGGTLYVNSSFTNKGTTNIGGELIVNGAFTNNDGTFFHAGGDVSITGDVNNRGTFVTDGNLDITGNISFSDGTLVVVNGDFTKSGNMTSTANIVVTGSFISNGGTTTTSQYNGSLYIFESCNSGCTWRKDLIDWLNQDNPWGFSYVNLTNGSAIYDTPGTYTFNVPNGVTSVTVQCWGGGGRGGTTVNNNKQCGGGGGGAFSGNSANLASGSNHTVIVGIGSTTTAPGGTSSFGTPPIATALGGYSVANESTTGATGGTVSIGNGFTGGNGANGIPAPTKNGGGGGSSAGTSANGTSATNINGAIAPPYGGNGGKGSNDGTIASPGDIPGGGGGGGAKGGNTGGIGGNGANGRVVVSWTSCTPNTISLSSGSETQTFCLGNSITTITYSTTGATGATITGLPGGVSGSWSSNVVTISGTPNASGTFNYQVTLIGGCGTATASGTITVNPTPSAPTAGYSTPVCEGGNLSLTASTITGANYSWSGPGFTSSSQNPVINNITSANSGTYSVTATINGCISPAGTVDITVNTIPVGTQDDITICSEDYTNYTPNITPESTFIWTIKGSVSGASDNPTPTNIINQLLSIPSNVTQGSVEYNVTPTSTPGGCVGNSFNITVTVEHPAIGGFN